MSLGYRRGLCVVLSACLFGTLAAGCGKAPPKQEPAKLSPALQAHVLDAVPSDIQHRMFVDFGGKVHLLGYNIEPEGVVAPGGKVKLTLYWQSIARLGPGWGLFTHVLDARGHRAANIDNVGPLREPSNKVQALPPGSGSPARSTSTSRTSRCRATSTRPRCWSPWASGALVCGSTC